MGITYTTIKIRNPLKPEIEPMELTAKVDTDATLLVIPGKVTEIFNFPVIRKQTVKYANEFIEEKDVAYAVEVEVCGRKGVSEAIVEPKKNTLFLGQ